MAIFKVGDEELYFTSFWYHYKEYPKAIVQYSLSIKYSEYELIHVIEKYSKKNITDMQLQQAIVEKDRIYRSLGLFFYIFNHLSKNNKDPLDWLYVINNVKEVIRKKECLIIKGQASKWLNE